MDIQTILADASENIGGNTKVKGLMRKEGRLKPGAEKPEDVLGFDYLVHLDNTCFEYYSANPPLHGTTQAVPVPCPVGIEIFDDFKVDYTAAITIFHRGNWGSQFTSMTLSKPLVYPQTTEPYWYMVSNLGQTVIIGADSGEIVYPT